MMELKSTTSCDSLLLNQNVKLDLSRDEEMKNNEIIFPSDEYLNKCYIFTNVSDEVYSYMQEQFVKIQA